MKFLLQPRNVVSPGKIDWATIICHYYRGLEIKAAVDSKENLTRALTHTATDMTKNLVQQYKEANGAHARLFKGTHCMVVPDSLSSYEYSNICVQMSATSLKTKTQREAHKPSRKTAPLPLIVLPIVDPETDNFLERWVPVVQADGYCYHMVLTEKETVGWHAYRPVVETNSLVYSLGEAGILLQLMDYLGPKKTNDCYQWEGLTALKIASKSMRSFLESDMATVNKNIKYRKHIVIPYTEVKQVFPPMKMSDYAVDAHHVNLTNYHSNRIHIPQSSDMKAYIAGLGMDGGGNLTHGCWGCQASKKSWQEKCVSEEEACDTCRTFDRSMESWENMCMAAEDREAPEKGADPRFYRSDCLPVSIRKNQASRPIFGPHPLDTCPVPLHTTLGLADGDIRENCLLAIRLLDGSKGQEVSSTVATLSAQLIANKENTKTNQGYLQSKKQLDVFKAEHKSNGINLTILSKRPDEQLTDTGRVAVAHFK